MSLSETPYVYITVIILTGVWVIQSVVGVFKAIIVTRDSNKDVTIENEEQINPGRMILARLVRTMGISKTIAFGVWFFAGLYVISPWSLNQTGPPWRRIIVPFCLVIGQSAMLYSLNRFHSQRQYVLNRDMKDEALRREAALLVAAERLDKNTSALDANTQATLEATQAITNGPMQAQIESTHSMDELRESTDELKVATDANTAVLEVKTTVNLKPQDPSEE